VWIVVEIFNNASDTEILEVIVIVTNSFGRRHYKVNEFVFQHVTKRGGQLVQFSLNVPNAQGQANTDLQQLYSDVIAEPSLLPSSMSFAGLVSVPEATVTNSPSTNSTAKPHSNGAGMRSPLWEMISLLLFFLAFAYCNN